MIRRVLVVVKKSSRNPFPRRFLQAREEHRKTLRQVLAVLRREGISAKTVVRMSRSGAAGYDLVLSVGGDGTFLEAARGVRGQPILGVNSDPRRSVGSFCAADAGNFGRLLRAIRRGRVKTVELNRIQILLNGRPTGDQVLNEILVTHRRPAAMSRYWLQIGRRREEQRSSGLWIATAAGSTGAIRSAGGREITRESRWLQYCARELYPGGARNYRLKRGQIRPRQIVRVGSLMEEGLICVDGEHVVFPFRCGDRLEIVPSMHPLRLIEHVEK